MADKQVRRYDVSITEPTQVPAGAAVLFGRTARHHKAGDEAVVDAWFEVTLPDGAAPDCPMQEVQVFGTGHLIPLDAQWLASFIDGPLVWHLYALGPVPPA